VTTVSGDWIAALTLWASRSLEIQYGGNAGNSLVGGGKPATKLVFSTDTTLLSSLAPGGLSAEACTSTKIGALQVGLQVALVAPLEPGSCLRWCSDYSTVALRHSLVPKEASLAMPSAENLRLLCAELLVGQDALFVQCTQLA
jgi:hypothetical protein